jgi:hypothetical protein
VLDLLDATAGAACHAAVIPAAAGLLPAAPGLCCF